MKKEKMEQELKVFLPRFSSVKNVILKYSSAVSLNTGARFRVCNICGKKLPSMLNREHKKHLKTHHSSWKSYKKRVAETLEQAMRNDTTENTKLDKAVKEPKNETSSSDSDSEGFLDCQSVIHTLGTTIRDRPPPLTLFEKKQYRKFSYDRHPVKEFREFSDIRVMKMCNNVKCQQIDEFVGHGVSEDLLNPNMLYTRNSDIVNKIARLLCEKQCYYDPSECFFDDNHTFDFKELMKKELHDKFTPSLSNILYEQSDKNAVLTYDENYHPETLKLCEKIGFTTQLQYNKSGYLDLNYDLFCRQLWYNETPLFVLEEKKVLDVILALLIAASRMYKYKRDNIENVYSQNASGINRPILALMHHGPGIQGFTNHDYEQCDIEKDEYRSGLMSVSHKICKNYSHKDYWKYKHKEHENPPVGETDYSNCGPSSIANQSVVYPCDMGHWHACTCLNCNLLRNVECTNHKIHMQYNVRKCQIKEAVACDEHYLDHPENFTEEDITVETNIFYHNKELLKSGRNYRNKKILFAGKKKNCKKCQTEIQDHFKNHHVLHVHCDICVHESKSSGDTTCSFFWDSVCKICGKKYESKDVKDRHMYKHEEAIHQCEYCGKYFLSKFAFQRHLTEQHQVHQQSNNGPYDGTTKDEEFEYVCKVCKKVFKYERNVYAHLYEVHDDHSSCHCNICGKTITKKSNLKRHLQEQHDVLDTDREVKREEKQVFICHVCEKEFNRKSNLLNHIKCHDENRSQYKCSKCVKTFFHMRNLKAHEKEQHSSEAMGHRCKYCNVEFVSKRNLKQHLKIHEEQKKEFKCSVCGKVFQARRTLTRHNLINH